MENLDSLVLKIPAIVHAITFALTAITLAATCLVRITPNKTDDQAVGKFSGKLLKVLHWLPTIGINPQTKKLEEEIYELREKTNPGV